MNRNKPSKYLLALFCLVVASLPAPAFTSRDATTVLSSYKSAFYTVSGTNGYFKDTQTGGIAYFWGQAEMIECAIDAYEWTTNVIDKGMITNLLNGFIQNNGSTWTGDIYNDDIMWAVIAFARGGQDIGNTNYCNIAKVNFDACYARAWDSTLGGGLYWNTADASKNACVNGPAAIAACLLYQIYGDTNYWNKATNIYAWERSVLFNPSTGAIYDNIGTNGVLSTWSSTYNQGTFIGAADLTGQTNDAVLALNYTMTSLTTGGILPQYGIAGNNSGFNAIFLRWMTRFMRNHALQGTYEPWLQLNASAAWNMRRTSDNLSWCQWLQPSPAGTNFYSWDCISSFEALAAATPTSGASSMAVPADYIGYWPLDATNGTVAVDVSGNGNNGTVTAAAWNTNGRVNGCLSFNGSTSSVQITNVVSGDFSIVFWVKTTQTAGTGQWYNGAGLADGDYPGVANDFGTALCGGKLAFGVGNPDTTIVSTNSINNGAWHQCVAARQLATGAISLYVDGNLQATGAGNKNSLNASARLLFGAIASGGGYFNGCLDDIKLFARTLSSNEVSALYNSSLFAAASAPTNLAARGGNLQVPLSWWQASDAASYNVKRSLTNGGPYVALTNISTASYTDTNVVNNRTYYYVVSSVNAVGEGPNSAQASASPSPLAAWFKADAITGLTNGAAVPAWPDSSGNGYTALQTLSANQPLYVTGALGGLPVVRFSSTNSTYLWFYRPIQDDFTMIFVYQSRQGIGTGTDFWDGAGLINAEVAGTVNDFGTSLNAAGQVLAGTGNPDTTVRSSAGLNDGHPHVVTFKRTESSGLITLYVDGTEEGAAIAGTQSLTSPNQVVLGAQQTLNSYLSGDLAEVQIYSAALADTDRIGEETALKCKYGLSGGAAPATPSGLTAVAGNREIALNWVLISGATGYNLYRSINNGASYQTVAASLTNSSFVDINAVSGQTNYYEIAATDGCGVSANSAALGVYLPLPVLTMILSANLLAINWPGWANDWKLYATTNLAPPVAWWPATNLIGSNNGAFTVTIAPGSGMEFFRLGNP
jgi:predicted alpha-1,6-mannanase (GH76 family)